MRKKLNLTGQVYGLLTVLYEMPTTQTGGKYVQSNWRCKCECGNEVTVNTRYLREREYLVKSCGCLFTTVNNMSRTRQYRIWFGMKSRCDVKTNTRYPLYGGRGISYDPKWNDFNVFWEDMKDGYKDNLSLDRIDNNKDYSKDNCRWVDQTKQVRNRNSTVTFEYNGIEKPLATWAEEYGFSYWQLYDRVIRRGWNIERALTQPLRKR